MAVPMLTTYCRRCHAAIMSNARTCPLCGLSRPNYANLTETEKKYLSKPPSATPERFDKMTNFIVGTEPFFSQLWKLYSIYFRSDKDSKNHQNAFYISLASLVLFIFFAMHGIFFLKHLFIMIFIISTAYLVYDSIAFIKAAYSNYIVNRLQIQGGASPYSVHFKVETVLQNSLKGLQSLLYAFYEKPWEEMAKTTDILQEGSTFIAATQAITSKIKKFAGISLETITLLWRNNVYAITSFPDLSYDDKINHLNIKIMEAKAVILRYCWFRELEHAYEFLEAHLKGESGRSTADDSVYVIEGMQLGLMGPLTEPYTGNLESVPYDLPFIMRYYWHQQLRPSSFPEDDIKAQYPETSELFESIGQVQNLINKLNEQKIMNIAEEAVKNDFKTETEITSEAHQIKRFQLYSDYLDIPKFQPSDAELLKQVDRLNAQIRVEN